jgi:hypothetical protein
MSATRLWQKQLARRSTASCVGTATSVRMAVGGRKDIWVIVKANASALEDEQTHNEVLQDGVSACQMHVCTAGEVRRLL